MKKPNITEGEWYLNELNTNDFNLETREYIIARHIKKRNAKAMLAVPDLIEEGMKVYEMLNSIADMYSFMTNQQKEFDKRREELGEALKKAGVDL